jgi:TRAP-type C4-dicarboxylate transport system permease small subunit
VSNEDLNIVNRITKSLILIAEVFCGMAMMVMVVITTVSVFFRYVLGSSLPWVTELTRYLLVWLGLVGAALALEYDEHVSISFVYDRSPRKVKVVLDLIRYLMTGYFAYIMITAGYQFAQTRSRGQFSGIPGIVPRMAIPVSGVLIIIFLINRVVMMKKGGKQ